MQVNVVIDVTHERIFHREFPTVLVQVSSSFRHGNPNDHRLGGARVSVVTGLCPNFPLIRGRDAASFRTRCSDAKIIRRDSCFAHIFQQFVKRNDDYYVNRASLFTTSFFLSKLKIFCLTCVYVFKLAALGQQLHHARINISQQTGANTRAHLISNYTDLNV